MPSDKDWHPVTDCGRLTMLSDGIFAVAMTLSVVQIMPPDLTRRLRAEGGGRLLAELFPQFIWIVVVFMLAGAAWVTHHRLFSYIRRTDSRFLFLNLLFLLGVALMPFGVQMTAAPPGDTAATVFYSAYLGWLVLTLHWIWGYATRRHRLVDAHLDRRIIRYHHYRTLYSSAVMLVSCAVAFHDTTVALFCWLLVLPNRRIAARLAERKDSRSSLLEEP